MRVLWKNNCCNKMVQILALGDDPWSARGAGSVAQLLLYTICFAFSYSSVHWQPAESTFGVCNCGFVVYVPGHVCVNPCSAGYVGAIEASVS